MSIRSIQKLAILAGAVTSPRESLYPPSWPSRRVRLGQFAYNLIQRTLAGDHTVALVGAGMPCATGRVRITKRPSIRQLTQGACVLRNASIQTLCDELEIDPSPEPEFYLADAGVLVILGTVDGRGVIIHVSEDKARIDRYHRGCLLARSAIQALDLAHQVPSIINRRNRRNCWILVQERLLGRTIAPATLAPRDLLAHLRAALDFLYQLQAAAPEDQSISDAAMYRDKLDPLMGVSEFREHVESSLSLLHSWPHRTMRSSPVAHGDYCFPNLLFAHHDVPVLCGVIDWEKARTNATLGVDAVYFLIMSMASLEDSSPMKVLTEIVTCREGATCTTLISEICFQYQITRHDVSLIAVQTWLMHLARQCAWKDSWSPTEWRDWLERPSSEINLWLRCQVGESD